MSKLKTLAAEARIKKVLHESEAVTNFMGGTSYELTPVTTLKMISASSIFGEPSYYRKGSLDEVCFVENRAIGETIAHAFVGETTTAIFTKAIDAALDYDFDATVHWAVELRQRFNMRLNPQIIMVRAALHPKRKEWTSMHPGEFNAIQMQVMSRADEPATQLAYYIAINGGIDHMPTILKKTIRRKLSDLTPYQVNKYKNSEIGIIDATRITHATSCTLSSLLHNELFVPEEDETWEQKRSAGQSWMDILATTKMGHMALLRNLRGIFTEIDNGEICKAVLDELKSGVLKGKQFPFRYYIARDAIKNSLINNRIAICDALEECMDIAIENMKRIPGKTAILTDNSGSAWKTIPTANGSVQVAVIDNLSAVITAKLSDEGTVIKFGNRYKEYPIGQRNGILSDTELVSSGHGNDVGLETEGGIWEWFKNIIDNKIWYDNIFIYSDMQAGHGGLYGLYEHVKEYKNAGYEINYRGINIYKLLLDYRKKVNPKCSFFSIQTAGYNNIVVPEMIYRGACLYGWTGKESEFALEYLNLWDQTEEAKKIN